MFYVLQQCGKWNMLTSSDIDSHLVLFCSISRFKQTSLKNVRNA